jgi:2-C-methyl-D-erythritol 2,4-cyclodiphosphate synthase
MKIRIGIGYDVHQLVEGLPFRLGGVTIPHHKGALGHSDADVLIHAICDAMLGAVAMGDIGTHFPDTHSEYKGIDSTILLEKTHAIIKKTGYSIENIDSVVILQNPKVKPFIESIRHRLSDLLKMDVNDISIKATTTEKLGFTGREEGVAAEAVVLLKTSKK